MGNLRVKGRDLSDATEEVTARWPHGTIWRSSSWDCGLVAHDYANGQLADGLKGTADFTFADPPYNIGVRYADDATSDKLPEWDYQQLMINSMEQARFIGKPGAVSVWVVPEYHADWFGLLLDQIVGPRLYRVVWYETFAQYQGDRALTKDYRFIYINRIPGGDPKPAWNPQDIRIKSVRQEIGDTRANPNGRIPGCVWTIRRLQGTSVDHVDWHPTQLAPELLARCIKGWSNPGNVVADMFAGSGSAGKVARATGRGFIGIDRSPKYLENMRRELDTTTT